MGNRWGRIFATHTPDNRWTNQWVGGHSALCIIQVSSGCFQFPYCLLNVSEFFNGCLFFELCNGCLLTVQLMSPSCAMGVVLVSFNDFDVSSRSLVGLQWMCSSCSMDVLRLSKGCEWMLCHCPVGVLKLSIGCLVGVRWMSMIFSKTLLKCL